MTIVQTLYNKLSALTPAVYIPQLSASVIISFISTTAVTSSSSSVCQIAHALAIQCVKTCMQYLTKYVTTMDLGFVVPLFSIDSIACQAFGACCSWDYGVYDIARRAK